MYHDVVEVERFTQVHDLKSVLSWRQRLRGEELLAVLRSRDGIRRHVRGEVRAVHAVRRLHVECPSDRERAEHDYLVGCPFVSLRRSTGGMAEGSMAHLPRM